MAKCNLITKRARRDWTRYLDSLTALNNAQERKHSLRTYGTRDGNPKKSTHARAMIKANAAIKTANSKVSEAKRQFERTEKVLLSCMKKGA